MAFSLLEGKVAIITGAAMGMGRATAELFAASGAKVMLADMNVDLGQSVVDGIRRTGRTAEFFKDRYC